MSLTNMESGSGRGKFKNDFLNPFVLNSEMFHSSKCSDIFVHKLVIVKRFHRYIDYRKEFSAYRLLQQHYDKHDFFLKLLYWDDKLKILVFPKMKCNLLHCLRLGMDVEMKKKILFQIFEALKLFHKIGLVHMDLKLENILISDDGHAMLADFSSTVFLHANVNSNVGTGPYQAPELIECGPDNIVLARPEMDLWSFGILAFVVIHEKFPMFLKQNFLKQFYPIEVYHIVKRCLKKNPIERRSDER